ncbi:MAG: hypothetical protein EBU70_11295, partial [Actinobacteria bacterium]|nr:hypothetical protein [Actinomycetota bacterium]
PDRIALAAVAYANANAGVLRTAQQAPASVDGNGNLDAAEFATVSLCGIGATDGCCPADLSGDSQVTGADLGLLLAGWGGSARALDLNSDGAVNGADLGLLLSAWGPCSP